MLPSILAMQQREPEVPISRIVFVDEHRSFAETMQIALKSTDDMRIVGIEETAAEGCRRIRGLQPDLVISSQRLDPASSGLELARDLRRAERNAGEQPTPFVLLTSFATPSLVRSSTSIEKMIVLSKRSSLKELVNEFRNVLEGRVSTEAEAADPYGLTRSQQEVLDYLARGLSPTDIAAELGLSVHAIRARIRGLLNKTNSTSQLEAVSVGIRAGLVCPL